MVLEKNTKKKKKTSNNLYVESNDVKIWTTKSGLVGPLDRRWKAQCEESENGTEINKNVII